MLLHRLRELSGGDEPPATRRLPHAACHAPPATRRPSRAARRRRRAAWNSRINVWIRSPGLTLSAYCIIQAVFNGPSQAACPQYPPIVRRRISNQSAPVTFLASPCLGRRTECLARVAAGGCRRGAVLYQRTVRIAGFTPSRSRQRAGAAFPSLSSAAAARRYTCNG